MDTAQRIERALELAIDQTSSNGGPPKLAQALRYSVFPGGARVRPRLTLAVADACGAQCPKTADGAAAAIELLHCASLVHDDLPCFDNAPTRRGRPSVHVVFGEPLALLAGDALIALAFETLAQSTAAAPHHLTLLLTIIARSAGAPNGIAAGQAWESELNPPPQQYRCAKTGSLFVAATMCGALAGGGEPAAWSGLGHCLGEAYQVADDLFDALAGSEEGGKPVGCDAKLGRPNAVAELGIAGAVDRLQALIEAAMQSIPSCRRESELRELVRLQALRLAPKRLARRAA